MCTRSALLTHIEQDVNLFYEAQGLALSGHDFVACQALKGSIVKKFEDTSDAADKAAIEKFLDVNKTVGHYIVPNYEFGSISGQIHASIKYNLWKVLTGVNAIEASDIDAAMRPGPGSSVGVKGNTLFEKFASGGLTATDSRLTQLWMSWNRKFGYIEACELLRAYKFGPPAVVDSSMLTTVPKNSEISRTICTEPLINMLFQQGIKSYLERRLKAVFGIDLETQQRKNKLMAQGASVTGRFATIDLSSASDTISTKLVLAYFPKVLTDWLMWTRTSFTKLPNGDKVELNMISSMGNAFTFPLQTFIFASVVKAVYDYLNIPLLRPRGLSVGNFGVNGDDIIVVAEAFDLTVKTLGELGFIVNVGKTFSTGNFRESCGGDYYNGHDVRGVYAKTLDSLQDIYSLVNRLNNWSEAHRICMVNTVQYLLSLIASEDKRKLYVPLDESETAGIRVPYRVARPNIVYRHGAGSFLYRAYEAKKITLTVPTDSRTSYALAAQLLFGGATHTQAGDHGEGVVRITVRPMGAVKYVLRDRIVPRWDYTDMTSTVRLGRHGTGLPNKWNYLVLNLKER